MRKFLIAHCYGRYWWKPSTQSKYHAIPRGLFWYISGMMLITAGCLISGSWWGILIPWLLIAACFCFPGVGMSYFQNHPIQWRELDLEQKWYYGQRAMSNKTKKLMPFSSSQMSEWMAINRGMKKKYLLTQHL